MTKMLPRADLTYPLAQLPHFPLRLCVVCVYNICMSGDTGTY